MAESSESERDGLNAMGNPEIEYRSEDGGRTGEGYIGQTFPTGILARGTADKALWGNRGGMNRGTERQPSKRK